MQIKKRKDLTATQAAPTGTFTANQPNATPMQTVVQPASAPMKGVESSVSAKLKSARRKIQGEVSLGPTEATETKAHEYRERLKKRVK